MTALERAVADALRLSKTSSEMLLDTIQRNIETARAELLRSGVSEAKINEDNILVEDAIISFCVMRMTDGKISDYAERAFLYAQDNLRKS